MPLARARPIDGRSFHLFLSSAADMPNRFRIDCLVIPNNRLAQLSRAVIFYGFFAAKRLCTPAFIGVHSGPVTQLGERKTAWVRALATDRWLWLLSTYRGFWLNSYACAIRSAHIARRDFSIAIPDTASFS